MGYLYLQTRGCWIVALSNISRRDLAHSARLRDLISLRLCISETRESHLDRESSKLNHWSNLALTNPFLLQVT